MKKKILSLLAVLATGATLCACSFQFGNESSLDSSLESSSASSSVSVAGSNTASSSESSSESSIDSSSVSSSEESSNSSSESSPESSSESSSEDSSNSASDSSSISAPDDSSSKQEYAYTAFTMEEEELFNTYFGFVIPFVANDVYDLEEYRYYYDDTNETEVGLNFYAYDTTSAQFNAYKAQFTTANGYTYDGSDRDGDGDTWYYYSKNGYYVDMSYYADSYGDYLIDVYVYELLDGDWSDSDDSSDSSDSSSGGGSADETDGFTAEQKALFNEYFDFVIPFIESDEYYVDEYTYYYEDTDETEIGINYYAYNVTQSQYNAYKAQFTTANGYEYEGSDVDDEGDRWYYYSKNGYYVDMSYYADSYGDYLIDVYVYELLDGDWSDSDDSSDSSDDGAGDTPTEVEMLTNAGKGLPTDADGVYDVDFTKASYVKNVTDQGYYLDGCPTVGSPKVLVIPVEFSDCTAKSKGYEISAIKNAFEKNGTNDYFSVYDYYFASSYGKLTLDITVLDSWFKPSKTSSYYESATIDYYGDQMQAGDQMIMDEALAYLSKTMDLSAFDSDNNDVIDAIIMINTLQIDSEKDFHWAYRYWNFYTDDGYYYEYDGVSANDYLWASYQFLYETYDADGNVSYDDERARNTYTFIHEFGHVLGADDYYDTSYTSDYGPMEGCDIMDGMTGDHNAFTKFNYGWLTSSKLVVTNSSVTLSLEDFSKNGDTILLANNWDEALGAYQEYYILAYYTNTGLNGEVNGTQNGYFSREGIVVYHVNASLCVETVDGETYYDIYNNNTDASDEYGTEDNLIEYVQSANDTFTYAVGDSLPASVKDDNGDTLKYGFVIESMENGVATITFTKRS